MCEPSTYRAYKCLADLRGCEVLELFPGDFSIKVTRSNPGSLFIKQEGFLPYLELLRPFAGDVSEGEKRIAGWQLKGLQLALDLMWRGLAVARSADELRRISPRICVTDRTFPLVRPEVVRTVASFAELAHTGSRSHGCLWILGIRRKIGVNAGVKMDRLGGVKMRHG